MSLGPRRRLATAAVLAVAVAGCGLGEGSTTEGEATLTVTRDYGAETLVTATVTDPPETETVIRFLDREAEITTRYGGGFVQSIEGLAGGVEAGRSFDWFFYVDGIESPVGSADREVLAGHRIWWDYRDWSEAMRVPAVVGSWPEPFSQSSAAEPKPVTVECLGGSAACDTVSERLEAEGVDADRAEGSASQAASGPRVLVGPWNAVAQDPAAAQLEQGPATSGVFARFEDDELVTLDERGAEAARLADAGLIAALRLGQKPVTWIVTAPDDAGVEQAAEALTEDSLADRYAIAVGPDGDATPLPAEGR